MRRVAHLRSRAPALLARAFACALALASPAWAQDGCANLDAQPPTFTVSYSSIQAIFRDNGCTDCHESHVNCDPDETAITPSAQLDLCPGASWSQLVNHASSQDGTLPRVLPNQPRASLLFDKINCDPPVLGMHMPLGGNTLSEYDQALIHDWIAGGAPVGTTDTIFRGEFEPRG